MCPQLCNSEELEFDSARKERLLFGLLNARVTLATLRSALALYKLDYPSDLARITLGSRPIQETANVFTPGSTGVELNRWATELESQVCDAIDSFGSADVKGLPGNETFSSLGLLQKDALLVDGKPAAQHLLLSLDDVHHLTHRQRSRVLKVVTDLRTGVGVWLAERFEALAPDEMLATGTAEGAITKARFCWNDIGAIIRVSSKP